MKIDRTNMNWNKSISDEEILNRNFSIGALIQSNTHIDLINTVNKLVLSTYKVTAIFKDEGFNGERIYCNGQCLAWRSNKRSPVRFGKNVKLIEGTPTKMGGSNQYPAVYFKEDQCTLEFISYGLPYIDTINGWGIKILKLEEI